MRIECTNCDHSFSVADDRKGTTVRCPECKEPTKVPSGKAGGGKGAPTKSSRRDSEGITERKKTSVTAGKQAKKTQLARPAHDDVDDDDEDDDDRPQPKSKARRARDDGEDDRPARKRSARRDDDDAEDDDARPSKSKGKEKEAAGLPLIWILSGVGGLAVVGIAVLVVFLMRGSSAAEAPKEVAANAAKDAEKTPQTPAKDPGKKLPAATTIPMTPMGGSAEEALQYLPAGAEMVSGINFSAPGSSFYKKSFDKWANEKEGLDKDLLDGLDKVIFANGPQLGYHIIVAQTKKAIDKDKLQKSLKAGTAEQIKGKTVFRNHAYGHDAVVLVSPTLVIICDAKDDDLGKLLENKKTSLRPDILSQVRSLQGHAFWSVLALDAAVRSSGDVKQMAGAAKGMGMEEVIKIVEGAKLASAFANPSSDAKSLRADAAIVCASASDAGKAASILKPKAKEMLPMAAQFFPGPLTTDISKTLEISANGANLTASLTLSEAAFKQLENLGSTPAPSPKMPPNYPMPTAPIVKTAPPPTPNPSPGPNPLPSVAQSKVIFEADGKIEKSDLPDQKRPGSNCKCIQLVFEAGKTYTVEMKQAPGSPVDPYVYLMDGYGNMLAFNDNGGGSKDARIVHKATQSGSFMAVASTSGPKQYGSFKLVVSESGKATNPNPGTNPANPAANPANAAKVFTGSQSLKNYNHLEFLFQGNNQVTMTNKDGKTQGMYEMQGSSIVISFQQSNRFWYYVGQTNGQMISGQASGTAGGKSPWSFTVNLKAPPPNPNPVKPNPGVNPNPMPPVNAPPTNPNTPAFVGNELGRTGPGSVTKVNFQFPGNNQVIKIDDSGTTTGTYTLQGTKISMSFNANGAQPSYKGDMISTGGLTTLFGEATNGKDKWHFQTATDKAVNLPQTTNPGINPAPNPNPAPPMPPNNPKHKQPIKGNFPPPMNPGPPPMNPGPPPMASALGNSSFVGSETLKGYGRLEFRFAGANQVTMIDKDGQSQGTYTVQGNSVTIRFTDKAGVGSVYNGTINGQTIAGSAMDGRSQWTFTVSK